MKCKRQNEVLEYLKSNQPNEELERHIEECEQCQAMVEGYLAGEEELKLPEEKAADVNLKERAEHYNKGRFRITIFTIVGLLLGFFSMQYVYVEFEPLKIVLAIPYKLSEIAHVMFHHHLYTSTSLSCSGFPNEFFPHSFVATFIGERVVASLAGGAVYGSLAYFTGDKKVFTLTRFIKFLGIWIAILGVAFGSSFLVEHIEQNKNLTFQNICGFFISCEDGGWGLYEDGHYSEEYEELLDAFYSEGSLAVSEKQRNEENENELELFFRHYMGDMVTEVNLEDAYLVADNGCMYDVPQEFCALLSEKIQEWENEDYENNEDSN